MIRSRRRSASRTLPVLALLVASLAAAGVLLAGDLPAILYADWEYIDKTYPTWVSAEAAFDESGAVIEERFHPLGVYRLNELFGMPADPDTGCIDRGETYGRHNYPPPARSLREAVGQATIVALGEITDRASGFDRAEPGRLLLVETVESLIGQANDFYYVFLQQGTLELGPYTVCKHDYRFPTTDAKPGDQVLLLLQDDADPRQPFVDLASENRFILLKQDGSAHSAENFLVEPSDEEARRLERRDDVLVIVRRAAAQRADRGGQ